MLCNNVKFDKTIAMNMIPFVWREEEIKKENIPYRRVQNWREEEIKREKLATHMRGRYKSLLPQQYKIGENSGGKAEDISVILT